MNKESILLSSKTIDIAENDLWLELTNRMCYYDDKNLNNVLLPYKGVEDKALECAKTLINMPVQARYKKIAGNDNLGSHEMRVDSDGDIVFETDSIGTHIDVWIEDTEVTTVSGETKVLPCLYAKKRIWKRNKNLINAIKRLYESENGLGSSWEIQTLEYSYKDGVKTLNDYVFLSDCLLGSNVNPAYKGTSKAISLSALDEQELMIAEALTQDMMYQNTQEKEEKTLEIEKENMTVSETEKENISDNVEKTEENVSAEISEEDGKENSVDTVVSELTDNDIRRKASVEIDKKLHNDWGYIAFMFPESHEIWYNYGGDTELDYYKFTYEVNDENVTVSEPERVTLTVSVKDINSTVAEYEKTISEKDELIVKASAEITTLKADNAELAEYKQKFTEMEQEKIASDLAQKKEDLIASVIKSGQITREEIEKSEELSGYVNELDKKSLMAIVGERLSASVDNSKDVKVDTSEVNELHIASNLNCEDTDAVSLMRKFINK
jgi:hypothetical protein